MFQRYVHNWLTFPSSFAFKYGHLLIFGQGNVGGSNMPFFQASNLPAASSARFSHLLPLCVWRWWGNKKESRFPNQAWKSYWIKKTCVAWLYKQENTLEIFRFVIFMTLTNTRRTERRLCAYEVGSNWEGTALCLWAVLHTQLHLLLHQLYILSLHPL